VARLAAGCESVRRVQAAAIEQNVEAPAPVGRDVVLEPSRLNDDIFVRLAFPIPRLWFRDELDDPSICHGWYTLNAQH